MDMFEGAAGETCGKCGNWHETTSRCPGMGYCHHPDAADYITRALVSVNCYLLPAEHGCMLKEAGVRHVPRQQ
jgi:hypothetical protein